MTFSRPLGVFLSTCPSAQELIDQARRASGEGIDGIELPIRFPLHKNAGGGRCVLEEFTGLTSTDVRVLAIRFACEFTNPSAALPAISLLLRTAASIGAGVLNLTLPPIHPAWPPSPPSGGSEWFPSAQDALNFIYSLLRDARFEAEAAGVAIALETCDWLSAFDLRTIIDEANSWTLGVCVEVHPDERLPRALDALSVLGRRVRCIRIHGPDAERRALATLRSALDDIQYSGPLITVGMLNVAEWLR